MADKGTGGVMPDKTQMSKVKSIASTPGGAMGSGKK